MPNPHLQEYGEGEAHGCSRRRRITVKGYINQRAVLTRRAAAVATLDDDALVKWIGCPS